MHAGIFSGIPSLCSTRHQVASVTTTGGSGPRADVLQGRGTRAPTGEPLPWRVATRPALHRTPRPMRFLKGDRAQSKAQRRGCPGRACTTRRGGAEEHFQGVSCWVVAVCPEKASSLGGPILCCGAGALLQAPTWTPSPSPRVGLSVQPHLAHLAVGSQLICWCLSCYGDRSSGS